MTEPKNWRDAKMPQWVRDAIDDDSRQQRLVAALAWPREAKPTPLPFQWGGYDILKGAPSEGLFWRAEGACHIRKCSGDNACRSRWEFSRDGKRWMTDAHRGPLFATQREARLNNLWDACERSARDLAVRWAELDKGAGE